MTLTAGVGPAGLPCPKPETNAENKTRGPFRWVLPGARLAPASSQKEEEAPSALNAAVPVLNADTRLAQRRVRPGQLPGQLSRPAVPAVGPRRRVSSGSW